MRIEEAAVILNRNVQTVRNYIRKGALRHELKDGLTDVNEADVKRLKQAMETMNPRKMTAAK